MGCLLWLLSPIWGPIWALMMLHVHFVGWLVRGGPLSLAEDLRALKHPAEMDTTGGQEDTAIALGYILGMLGVFLLFLWDYTRPWTYPWPRPPIAIVEEALTLLICAPLFGGTVGGGATWVLYIIWRSLYNALKPSG